LNVLLAGANKDAGQRGSIKRLLLFRQHVTDSAYVLRERGWPGPARAYRGCGFFHLDPKTGLAWLWRLLEFGPQPPYDAAALFGLHEELTAVGEQGINPPRPVNLRIFSALISHIVFDVPVFLLDSLGKFALYS
jgi:hypothetical protein